MADTIFIPDLPQISEITDDTTFVSDSGAETNSVKATQIANYVKENLGDIGTVKSVNGEVPDENGNIEIDMPTVINPNLLDNWCFGNPVNQRGITEKTGAGYNIDRWFSSNARGLIVVNENYITFKQIENPTSHSFLRQVLEHIYPGTYTLSGIVKGTGKIALYVEDSARSDLMATTFSFDDDMWHLVKVNYTVTGEEGYLIGVVVRADQNYSTDILGIKLEKGDTQTLAHQDADGNWVLNEIFNYGEQLARCQRYCIVLNTSNQTYLPIGGSEGHNTTTIYPMIPLPVSMRTTPTITYTGTWYAQNATTLLPITDIAFYRLTETGVMLKMTSSDVVAGQYYHITSASDSTAQIVLSADL